ncbi:minor tail protein [Mycobacterium phage MooMoo]|uniref:Minor tail protein n=1 Tax=Mycobacterium phage MooMoo TaxID=2108127 RepID=A0A2P1JR64_9CAUD|nr:minor tail protein [Mycobacterium phage MooMoo]AVO21627.1 minor tail protein [Mycobacterium phage MooMoo]
MAAGTWTLPNGARQNLLNGTFDIDSDSWKVALVTSSSNIGASTTTWAGVTGEVANGNGYTTGGIAVTLTLAGTTSVTVSFATNPVWTASGSGITARWAVLYEVSGNVLAYVLLDNTPADVSVAAGNTLTIDSDGTPSPVLTLA